MENQNLKVLTLATISFGTHTQTVHYTTSAERNTLAYKIAKRIKAFGTVDVVERKREDATSSH